MRLMRVCATRLNNRLVKIIKDYDMDGKNSVWGTDKNNPHTYCDFYEDLFEEYIDKEINILEIGSEFGCSALMFNQYLPKATIVSVDINPNIVNQKSKDLVSSKVSFHTLDAYSDEGYRFIQSLHPEGYDVIIDDGPHTLDSQILTVKNYINLLKPKGSMVIEDISTDFFCNVLESYVPKDCTSKRIDLKSLKYNVYDDLLLHIRK